MSSSVWSSVQMPASGMGSVSTVGDPTAMLNTQLANALSTMGDAQYWEESISPSTIRTSLASSDPSNPNSTPTLLRGMKWLLASISKGRNVSDFYPHVVKLVGSQSLEARKMVYMYLVQYADHDSTTRELSLLSINSFQRGLADHEQLIRALALRVLTSIRVPDILQIQILAIQKCASDQSPYVRKCAANALAKLFGQCSDSHQKKMLLDIMVKMLDIETSTMVLTSAVIAFSELCPDRLELLHGCFRKLCNLLADLDEWGQIVVIDTLARYCRKFFAAPRGTGSAEAIDAERRVFRTMDGIAAPSSVSSELHTLTEHEKVGSKSSVVLPPRIGPRKIKRRVVKKGFYSDEEDQSTEEEVYDGSPAGAHLPVSTVMRMTANASNTPSMTNPNNNNDLEDEHLNEDHRLLLRSSLPLLKSRNSGVVLAVCSLHYYCGVASIRVRSSLGMALVRIHRDRREIQYAVLTSIKTLVKECPSAFTPFLQDFFVKAMDPSFTRLIKLDILTLLALEPNSIDTVLREIRTYVRQDDDKTFVCAAIQAVGKVVELARIVHDRHGIKSGNAQRERKEANRVALNALYGLLMLTQASSDSIVVGECAIVMQRILLQLSSDNAGLMLVEDTNRVQEQSLKRLLVLLLSSLSSRSLEDGDHENQDEDDEENGSLTIRIPPLATATTIWMVGEWVAPDSSGTASLVQNFDGQMRQNTRLEVARLIARVFPSMALIEKVQSIHFASKLLVSSSVPREAAVCEFILSMGRAEVQTDVRDRARMESNLIQSSIGLQRDTDNMSAVLSGKSLTVDQVKKTLITPKPPSSAVPFQDTKEDEGNAGPFRFGTLSSLVHHRANATYLPLPKWADKDSPSSLRDDKASTRKAKSQPRDNWNVNSSTNVAGFYDSDKDDSDESSDEEESSSNFGSDDESDDEDDSDENSDESEDDSSQENLISMTADAKPTVKENQLVDMMNGGSSLLPASTRTTNALIDQDDDDDNGDDSDESEWDESDDESNESDESNEVVRMTSQSVNAGNLLDVPQSQPAPTQRTQPTKSNGLYAQGLEGLVMAPVIVDAAETVDPDIDRDSSDWMDLVRHELAGGLSVKARYLRGPTREREARAIGLDPSSPAVVLLQLRFKNMRTDTGVLRRVRIIARSTTTGHVGPRRTVIPQEIMALGKEKMTLAILGIEFQSVADKEGSLQGRYDLKSDRGNTPLDLRPPLCEMVKPLKIKPSEFDTLMSKYSGFQRLESNFSLLSNQVTGFSNILLKSVALNPIDSDDTWKEGNRRLRLVGCLPAGTDKLFILVQCTETGDGSFTVCCDNALSINSIMDTLKKSLK